MEGILLSAISQSQKKKGCDLTYIWNLKKLNTQKQRVDSGYQGRGGGGEEKMLAEEYIVAVLWDE